VWTLKRISFFLVFVLLYACNPIPAAESVTAPVTTTSKPVEGIASPQPELTATESVPTAVVEIQPQTVGCLHPENVETWCAGLEPKDPHGLWQNAIDALVDGPANADYWANTLGKTNPTHEEKLTWLAEHDYYLPASSPNGTEWVWIVGSPGYPTFKTNKVVTEAGGVSLANIRTIVISPEHWSEIKDWWRAQIDAQRSSPPITTSGATVYSPVEVSGWLAVENEETGLVEMVFVGGSSYIPDASKKLGYDEVLIGGERANEEAIFSAMWEAFMRASLTFTKDDLDFRSSNRKTPNMSIVSVMAGNAKFALDPRRMEEEEIWFE
jgi:hypothetical protein